MAIPAPLMPERFPLTPISIDPDALQMPPHTGEESDLHFFRTWEEDFPEESAADLVSG